MCPGLLRRSRSAHLRACHASVVQMCAPLLVRATRQPLRCLLCIEFVSSLHTVPCTLAPLFPSLIQIFSSHKADDAWHVPNEKHTLFMHTSARIISARCRCRWLNSSTGPAGRESYHMAGAGRRRGTAFKGPLFEKLATESARVPFNAVRLALL